MNWPWQVKKQVKIVHRSTQYLSIDEWRTNKAVCSEASKVINSNIFDMMLTVVKNAHPVNSSILGSDLAERAIHQARCEGYTLCIKNLESLGHYVKEEGDLQATFEREEQ